MTASGEPVVYSASKSAADLSLPRLMWAWDEAAEGSAAAAPMAAAGRAGACRSREVRRGRGHEDPDGIAHA
ncbi:hypothetical protein [Pseudonocardia yunnanensis]|uniref:Uncharacterized protein n=1 Tax=Pseudonocardia yunnanensis TaxID=58107 RepID=A0ABW4F9R7_9PSEU